MRNLLPAEGGGGGVALGLKVGSELDGECAQRCGRLSVCRIDLIRG